MWTLSLDTALWFTQRAKVRTQRQLLAGDAAQRNGTKAG
jgi:hypothetical protein